MATVAPASTLAFQPGRKRNGKKEVERASQLSQPLSKCAFLEALPSDPHPHSAGQNLDKNLKGLKCSFSIGPIANPTKTRAPSLREKRRTGIG